MHFDRQCVRNPDVITGHIEGNISIVRFNGLSGQGLIGHLSRRNGHVGKRKRTGIEVCDESVVIHHIQPER